VIISLDIDDTITKNPEWFALLSGNTLFKGGQTIINTSRYETSSSRLETEEQLKSWNICYSELYMYKSYDEVEHLCPHKGLEWSQIYQWQKIHHCKIAGATRHYEDDDEVIELFQLYAPEIEIIDVKKNPPLLNQPLSEARIAELTEKLWPRP